MAKKRHTAERIVNKQTVVNRVGGALRPPSSHTTPGAPGYSRYPAVSSTVVTPHTVRSGTRALDP